MAKKRKKTGKTSKPRRKPKPKYDVFISYSSKDEGWVRGELLKRIEKTGLRACVDFRDFARGAMSVSECERAVLESEKTLAVLTPDYIKSGWTTIENVMVQTLDPSNRDLRLIPLLKTKCKKPLRIGALTHVDFTDEANLGLAWTQLLTALGAPQRSEAPNVPERPGWFLAHPYPMPANFTGRVAEREMLTKWLNEDAEHPLIVLRALGGFGKSALVWHWLTHDIDAKKWARLIWWSFYEGDASFDHFLAETLGYLSDGKLDAKKISAKDAVKWLLDFLHDSGTLLILDGFERVLRAFGGLDAAYQGDNAKHDAKDRDCISPLAEALLYEVGLRHGLRSKVLLTTRLRPRILEARGGGLWQGCRDEELLQMQPADSVAFFRARGIRGTDVEIRQACECYGYHPLSLALLVGWIVKDVRQRGDIAAARRLDVGGKDEKGLDCQRQRQHHVLKASYESLSPSQKKLLGRIACFRSPTKHNVLVALVTEVKPKKRATKGRKVTERKKKLSASVTGKSVSDLDSDLQELVERGLLHHDGKENRFDLHPIVRRYAYDRMAAPERTAAHTRLRDYFEAVPKPDKVIRVEDLAQVIELYHHTVRAGQLDEAFELFRDRLHSPLYYQLGTYQLIIDLLHSLFPDGEDRPPRLKDWRAQGWTMNALANSFALSGQPRRAVPLFERHNAIRDKQDDKSNLAIGLANAAMDQIRIGALRNAEAKLRRTIELSREVEDKFHEAVGHRELSRLLGYRGAYDESEAELKASTEYWKEINGVHGLCLVEAYRAFRELLMVCAKSVEAAPEKSVRRHTQSSLAAAQRALELADEYARVRPVERDYVQAHWLLGAAHCVAGQHNDAERHLHEALERCRRINMVDMEADILSDLARLRAATKEPEEAQRLADEALMITERCGYVLQGADARLELAKLALGRGDRSLALEHAREARKLATCDGPPDYTYKVAYDEAGALLAELEGESKKSKGRSKK